MEPDQISATDVGLRPVNLFCRCSIPTWRLNQSQPTWYPTKYMQQTSGLPWSPSGFDPLCRQTPRLLSIFSNRLCSRSNYLQLMPRLPEIFPTKTRTFEPGPVAPMGPSQILTPSLPLIFSFGALNICTLERLLACLFLWYCGLRTLFTLNHRYGVLLPFLCSYSY